MKFSGFAIASWLDVLRIIRLKSFHMSVHPSRKLLVPMARSQSFHGMNVIAVNNMSVTVYVKAGEILITSHLMACTTVIKETVPIF